MQLRFLILFVTALIASPAFFPCPVVVGEAIAGEIANSEVLHQPFSLRARPKEHCSSFLIADCGLLYRAVNSQKTTDLYQHNGSHTFGQDFGLRVAVQGNFGLMFNLSGSNSLGFVGFGVVEEHRPRVGLKLRYRFWEWIGTAIDLEAGLVKDLATDNFSKDLDRRQWFVAGLSLSHTRFVHFVFQAESWLQDYPPNRRTTAVYVGLRFGY